MRIPDERLLNQHISRPRRGSAAGLVAHLGAVQAQEYPFAKWALALRLGGGTTDAAIEQALDRGEILRTHVLRPTWHFVTAADIRWMLELTAPRVRLAMTYYTGYQGLTGTMIARAISIIERALGRGGSLTRAELGVELARQRVTLSTSQLGLVCMYAELEGVICSGPRRGRRATYALLSERASGHAGRLERDEALAELARRYFRSHGPATVRDFVWWSGLKTSDARRALDIIRAKSAAHDDGLTYWRVHPPARAAAAPRTNVHLLPIYDEYLVAYRDRTVVPHATFKHSLIIDGQVAGIWRLERGRSAATLRVTPQRPLTRMEQRALAAAVERFARFLVTTVTVAF